MRFHASRLIIVVAAALAVVQTLAAQDDERYPPDPKAAKAFEELVKHYREIPAVEINCKLTIAMEQEGAKAAGEEITGKVVRSADAAGLVELRGFTSTIVGDTIWIVHESTDHSYYTEKFEDSPYWLLLNRFLDLPLPHLAILWGEAEMSDVWMQLHSRTPYLMPTKVEDAVKEDGTKERLITLSSPEASFVLHQNPETKLIETAKHEITGGFYVRDGAIIRTTYEFEHTVHENAADAPKIAFDPAGRQRVDFIAALVDVPPPQALGAGDLQGAGQAPAAALEGEAAPAFDLPLLGGGSAKLEDLKGQVVVLDFWATWCPPCRRALPLLHDVGKWAKAEELPVRVFAVNCWEEGDTNEAKEKTAAEFWTHNKYTLPVAMDYGSVVAAAYGVNGIPTTVVIRSDGVVHTWHEGAPDDYVEWLKGEIKDAIAALEAGAE